MKKRALLIGVNQYHLLGNLAYARQDAQAVSEALCRYCGFSDQDITLMTCQSEGACMGLSRFIEHALMNLTDERDLDLLVFGFWGHGFVPQAGRRYLCGMDTAEADLERTAVSFDVVKAKLAQVGAENTLLLLDCCQNRPTGRSASADPMTEGEEHVLASMARDIQAANKDSGRTGLPTVAILNACREGQKAYEWDSRGHGIFTAHLLDAFDQGFGSIAPMSTWLFDRVTKTSRELHQQDQTPYVTIEGKGDILFSMNERGSSVSRKGKEQYGDGASQEISIKALRHRIEEDFNEGKQSILNGKGSTEYIEKVWSVHLPDWQKGAENNWPEAQWLLGQCYEEGFGVEKDLNQAAQLYLKAAEQGDVLAQLMLASCYYTGKGVSKNVVVAAKWYRRAAEQGNVIASHNLGTLYLRGEGLSKDITEAAKWYQQAAGSGNKYAQFQLGYMYAKGIGVKQNWNKAVEWYRKAAEQEHAYAQRNLASCYLNSLGVPLDVDEAFKLDMKAAKQGLPEAQRMIGVYYETGEPVSKDKAKAIQWYRKAAEQGDDDAQKALEEMGVNHSKHSGPLKGNQDSSSKPFSLKLVKGTGMFGLLGGTREYDKCLNEIAKLIASRIKHGRVEIPEVGFEEKQSAARICVGSLIRAMQKRGFYVVDSGEAILDIYTVGKYKDPLAVMKEEMTGKPYVDAWMFEEHGYRLRVTITATGEQLWDGAIRVPKGEQ